MKILNAPKILPVEEVQKLIDLVEELKERIEVLEFELGKSWKKLAARIDYINKLQQIIDDQENEINDLGYEISESNARDD